MAKNRIEELVNKLRAQGCQPELLEEITSELQSGALDEANAGILRTRKGALMVRVSNERWPIAMYKKDWRILLSKVPFIEKAMEELDILEENPDNTMGKELAREAETSQARATGGATNIASTASSEFDEAMKIVRARRAS